MKIMHDVYEETGGYQEVIRRAKLMEAVVEQELYIDDNLFVGGIAQTVNGVYPYPEWNVQWMKDEGREDR